MIRIDTTVVIAEFRASGRRDAPVNRRWKKRISRAT